MRTENTSPNEIMNILSRRFLLAAVCMLWLLFHALPSPAQDRTDAIAENGEIVEGYVWVKFAADASLVLGGAKTGLPVFDRLASVVGVYEIQRAFPLLARVAAKRAISESAEELLRVYAVRFAIQHDPRQVATALERDSHVVYAEPRYKKRLYVQLPARDGLGLRTDGLPTEPDDLFFSDTGYMGRLKMTNAWDIVKGEDGEVVIAMVDGHTDWRHPDLKGNIWTNPGEVPNNGWDDDDNGYVDDIHGWNFHRKIPDPTGFIGFFLRVGHGTNTAGVAGAVTDNGLGIAGTSWNASIMPLNTSCSDLGVSICHSLEAVVYAVMHGADIINASFGSISFSETEAAVYQMAIEEGALVVAASGNTGANLDVEPVYPASFRTVLSVGGTKSDSDFNVFSYGRTVNVYAPSVDIVTTADNRSYDSRATGTSFSAPLVSGIAALVKTHWPDYTPGQIREQVRLTADMIDDAHDAGLVGLLGRGRVNAHRALTETGFPAIRVTDEQYSRDPNSLTSGEAIEIALTFSNFLADATDLSLELISDSPFAFVTSAPEIVGTLVSEDRHIAKFEVTIVDNAPYRTAMTLHTRAVASSYEDEPDVLRLMANPANELVHQSGSVEVSITTEGNIGYVDYNGNSAGRGFRIADSNGGSRDLLFEAGLVLGSGPNAVVDCVSYGFRNFEWQQSKDFVPKRGSKLRIDRSGKIVAEHGSIVLVDSGARNPLGLEILQESFVDTVDVHEDFIIFKYTVTNAVDRPHTDVHVGLFIDWDVDELSNSKDYAMLDSHRQLGYQTSSAESSEPFVGTKLLTSGVPFHFRVVDRIRVVETGLDDARKWALLSGGETAAPDDLGSWAHMVGAGPYSIDPQSAIEVAFALVTGTTEEDLLRNADAAQDLWESALQSVAGVQFIQNIAGIDVDLYLDGFLVRDDWAFRHATRFLELEGGMHTVDIVASLDADNGRPLASIKIDFGVRTSNQIIAYGSEEEVQLLVVDNVRRREGGSRAASFYLAHGARNAGNVNVRLLEEGGMSGEVLAENFGFGDVGSYVEVESRTFSIEVTAVGDGHEIGVYRLDLDGLEGQSFVLNLSGAGTSAADSLGFMGVLSSGQVFLSPAVVTSVAPAEALPERFALQGNYPNPFNPATKILFDLPAAALVSAEIFDVLGRKVKELLPQRIEAGKGRFLEMSGAGLPSGVYLYRVTAVIEKGPAVQSGWMTLVR